MGAEPRCARADPRGRARARLAVERYVVLRPADTSRLFCVCTMTSIITASRGNANFAAGQLAGRIRPAGRWDDGLRNLFQRIWPRKTPEELAARIEISTRHAERILAGTRGISGASVRSLLHSDEGWAVLETLMEGCASEWWSDL